MPVGLRCIVFLRGCVGLCHHAGILVAPRVEGYVASVTMRMVWLPLVCLLPALVLWAEFIFATEAAHVLLANFAGPIITLVSRKLYEWKSV